MSIYNLYTLNIILMLNGSTTVVLGLYAIYAITGYLAKLSEVMIARLKELNHMQYVIKYET